MRVEGSYPLPGPPELVWSLIRDPEVLARILPGCKRLDQVEENRYEGTLEIKIGPIQGAFDGVVEFTEVQAPESAQISISGQGTQGFVNGTGRFWLKESDGGTLLTYEGDAQIGGRLAAIGQRLVDSSAKAIIQAGLEGLEAEVRARTRTPAGEDVPSSEAMTPPPERTQAAFAAGVVRHMVSDALHDEEQRAKLQRICGFTVMVLVIYVLFRLLRGGSDD